MTDMQDEAVFVAIGAGCLYAQEFPDVDLSRPTAFAISMLFPPRVLWRPSARPSAGERAPVLIRRRGPADGLRRQRDDEPRRATHRTSRAVGIRRLSSRCPCARPRT
jgi:hypothetical protein